MSKEKQNKDLKSLQENLLGFFVSGFILLMLFFFYDEGIYQEGISTKSKAMRHFFKYLDVKFGKEYVFGFVIVVMLLFGIAALRGYLKEEKDSNKSK
ncbi:MAG: hypothetical protein WBJ36_04170 [Tenuifilum sp.]|uniref:hypothetical protein n=1 Tax=Tenuifilum sp. TaxID=2760880 RepID=UPI001B4E7695|nr:hypothetical protein [Bacteroidales bacterium]MBP9028274.1 hypothetical protein [Bacteroidales bacterium]HQG73321.1 hypothetical protein [Tenuifilum sp.]HRR11464.1 hypothetical protein [Tenuifilum sp.]HRU86843.1 hypothetical protein [Tenuifilum sp.]